MTLNREDSCYSARNKGMISFHFISSLISNINKIASLRSSNLLAPLSHFVIKSIQDIPQAKSSVSFPAVIKPVDRYESN